MKMLEVRRCRVVPASGGSEACDLLAQWDRVDEPFDVVPLDIHMPGLDGVATAARMRATGAGAPVALVVLTSVGFGRRALPADLRFAAVLATPVKQGGLDAIATASARTPLAAPPPGNPPLPLSAQAQVPVPRPPRARRSGRAAGGSATGAGSHLARRRRSR